MGAIGRASALTELFTLTATTLAARDPAHAKTWWIDAVPWTENRVEDFAGLHNQGRRILVVFDEASCTGFKRRLALIMNFQGAAQGRNTEDPA